MNITLRVLAISYLISHISYLSSAAMQPVELPPFTFAGRIVDYAHIAYGSDTVVEVRVKAQDGTLLAKTTTATGGKTSFNYALDVPLASEAASGHVKVGDTVVFEFVDPDGIIYAGLVPAANAQIGKPGEYRKVDVILATDSNQDGVPDEYVESIEYEMWQHGKSVYERDADWDGDGASNYAEYVAGTNPFDATDKFSVREMAEQDGIDDYLALRVMLNQGRTYTVETTGDLKPGAEVTSWVKTEFAVEDPTSALQGTLTTGPSETGYRTLYVKKEGAQRFWQLKVE